MNDSINIRLNEPCSYEKTLDLKFPLFVLSPSGHSITSFVNKKAGIAIDLVNGYQCRFR